MNVALCAIARDENLYIREWIEYHKNIGISKIFLYDNNELDGERFDDIINDYIQNNFVEVIDVRGTEKGCCFDEDGICLQSKCYIDCYENKLSGFDWVCFFDIDEFLTFKDGWDLDSFLNQDIFNDKDTILIKDEIYDDNNLIQYDDRPVRERFTHIADTQLYWVKSIVRTNKKIYDKNILHLFHNFRLEGSRICFEDGSNIGLQFYSIGVLIKRNWILFPNIKNDNICKLNHYQTKTIEEFIKRHLGRHWGSQQNASANPKRDINDCINSFFHLCNKTPEKIEYIKSLGFDVNL